MLEHLNKVIDEIPKKEHKQDDSFKLPDIKYLPPIEDLEENKSNWELPEVKDLPSIDDLKDRINRSDLELPDVKDLPRLDNEELSPLVLNIAPVNFDLTQLLESLEKRGLTPISDETKERLREQGWPDEIIDNLTSEEEVAIYEEAGLKPTKIGDKWCLTRTDIDYNQLDDSEPPRTNLERMKEGLAPLDKDGRPIQLHHIGQSADAPLAELTVGEHKTNRDANGRSNDTVLHDKSIDSEISREDFNKERKEYWKARAEEIERSTNQQ